MSIKLLTTLPKGSVFSVAERPLFTSKVNKQTELASNSV